MVKHLSDLPGGSSHEHATWCIGPVGQHRDSDLVEESNFAVACDRMRAVDPDEHDHEIHRFGHFAVGWVEEIAYRPGSECERVANEIRDALAGYPILDEDHHGAMESDALADNWPAILQDLKRDLVREMQSRIDENPEPDDMTADEIEDWIDSIDESRLDEMARDRGEIDEGWLKLSKHDIKAIADALVGEESV